MMNFLKRVFGVRLKAKKCGHKTKLKDKVTAFGETEILGMVPHKDGTVDYCHKCLKKMAIRCAWCGEPIFIGEFVTLYTPINKKFKAPECAVKYSENPLQFVGCCRGNCAETGADYRGRWMPPGKVDRFLSLTERCVADVVNGGDGIIICEDLSKL